MVIFTNNVPKGKFNRELTHFLRKSDFLMARRELFSRTTVATLTLWQQMQAEKLREVLWIGRFLRVIAGYYHLI